MNTAIIACKTIEDELRHAMAHTGTDWPVVWLEQGLHNVPDMLRSALQTALNDVGAQRVLLLWSVQVRALPWSVQGLPGRRFRREQEPPWYSWFRSRNRRVKQATAKRCRRVIRLRQR